MNFYPLCAARPTPQNAEVIGMMLTALIRGGFSFQVTTGAIIVDVTVECLGENQMEEIRCGLSGYIALLI